MGITGLLRFLKNDDKNKVSAIRGGHLREFRGKVAAVDAYSWLHKGIFSCAEDLFLGKPTSKYVDYCLKYINILKSFGIKPILVFDGGKMPFKVVEAKRRESRQNAKKKVNELIRLNQYNESRKYMVQAIDVTHEMASNLIKACTALKIDCIVAPYEADSQLAYLVNKGYADFVVTEDSDLIIFGCDTIFFKMNTDGFGEVYSKHNLEESLKAKTTKFTTFSFEKFRHAAILSGCDYVKNLPGIGLMKAWKFMNLTDNSDIRQFLKKVPSYLKIAVTIDDDYINSFIMANLAFQYQIVFDHILKKRVPLNKVEDINDVDYKKFLACFEDNEFDPYQLALGNIDSKNRVYDNFDPSTTVWSMFTSNEVKNNYVCGFDIRYDNKKIYRHGTKRALEAEEDNEDSSDGLFEMYGKIDLKKSMVQVKQEESQLKRPRKCKFVKYNTVTENTSKYFNKDVKVENEMEETESSSQSEDQPRSDYDSQSGDHFDCKTGSESEPESPILKSEILDKKFKLLEEPNRKSSHTETSSQKENVQYSNLEIKETQSENGLSPIIEQKKSPKKVVTVLSVITIKKPMQKKTSKGQQSILGFFKKI